jgi:type I restriction enzyme S subunit
MTIAANIGESAILSFDCACPDSIVGIRPDTNRVDQYFLNIYLGSVKKYYCHLAPQSAQHNLNVGTISSFFIPCPPLSEQKKISEILTIWDQAINETRLLIEAKKRLKKSLMQHLLTGKRRLPGFARSGDRKSYPFFDLPEDWECPQLIEIAQECLERNPGGNHLPVYTCSKYLGFVKSSEYFGKKVLSEETSFHKVIKPGWFGYPSNHIEEGSIGLLLNHEAGLVSPIYVVFKCDDSIDPEFLYAVFKTEIFRHIFARSTNASVDRRGSLRWKEFSLIRVPKPPSEEQREIVKVLKVADEEIHQFEAKLKTIETQKRGLMQKLLTGEVRVNLSHFR